MQIQIKLNRQYHKVIFSDLILREDHDFRDQIEEINGKLKKYCESKGYKFIENLGIGGGFLKRSKCYLNKKGRALHARNTVNVIKYIRSTSNSDGEFIDSKNSDDNGVSDLDSVKAVHYQILKNIIFSYININSIEFVV